MELEHIRSQAVANLTHEKVAKWTGLLRSLTDPLAPPMEVHPQDVREAIGTLTMYAAGFFTRQSENEVHVRLLRLLEGVGDKAEESPS